MSELEQEVISKLLLDLFFANPRKKSQIAKKGDAEETKENKPTNGQPQNQQAQKENEHEQI